MELQIGAKILKVRKEKKISIAQLSALSGVSTGLISQIERDIVGPSVTNLWKLAKALEVDVSYFFDEEERDTDNVYVSKAGTHMKMLTNNDRSKYLLLSKSKADRVIDMVEVRIKPGDTGKIDKATLLSHEGEECGYVTEGILTVVLGDKEYVLEKGDSITFDSQIPHRYINRHDVECVSIWSMTPKFF